MKIIITGESWFGLEPVVELVHELNEKQEIHALGKKNYGEDILTVGIVYCFKPGNYKQRKRYVKDQKLFAVDVIFNYQELLELVKKNDLEHIRYTIGEKLLEIVPVIRKYKLKSFRTDEFERDFKAFLQENNFLMKVSF